MVDLTTIDLIDQTAIGLDMYLIVSLEISSIMGLPAVYCFCLYITVNQTMVVKEKCWEIYENKRHKAAIVVVGS